MTVTYGLYKHRQRIAFTHKHENREGREGLITPMKEARKPGYIRKGLYYSSSVAELKVEPPSSSSVFSFIAFTMHYLDPERMDLIY
jgi:hypothetical protein